jgi:hypothetical protein
MSDAKYALTLQMLEWIGARPRDYREVMEAWRTSCPRLTVWEDAWSEGLLARDPETGDVSISEKGRALLERRERR